MVLDPGDCQATLKFKTLNKTQGPSSGKREASNGYIFHGELPPETSRVWCVRYMYIVEHERSLGEKRSIRRSQYLRVYEEQAGEHRTAHRGIVNDGRNYLKNSSSCHDFTYTEASSTSSGNTS